VVGTKLGTVLNRIAEGSELPDTERGGDASLEHPGSSVEPRAAARAMIGPDRMRAGDRGTEADGSWWFAVNNEETGGVTQIVFPCCFGGWTIDGKGHLDNCKATSLQRSVRTDMIAGERKAN
jgi:hypothetical protein